MTVIFPSMLPSRRTSVRCTALLLALSGFVSGAFGQSFAPAVAYPTGGDRPYGMALGDVDDGRLDLVAVNNAPNTVGVLLGRTGGAFAAPSTYPTGGSSPAGVALGDVNGDGRLDLAVANYSSSTVGVLRG